MVPTGSPREYFSKIRPCTVRKKRQTKSGAVWLLVYYIILLFADRTAASRAVDEKNVILKNTQSPENVSAVWSEGPRAESPGRQLVDISTAEASAGEPMKNGLLQRKVEHKIKSKTPATNGNINSSRKNENISTINWYIEPLALISEDCDEIKGNTHVQKTYEEKDMESINKDTVFNRKMSSLKSDLILVRLKGISHLHANEKERRDISDERRRKQQTDYINITHESAPTTEQQQTAVNLSILQEKQEKSESATENGDSRVTSEKDERSSAWQGRNRDTSIRFNVGPPAEKYVVPTLRVSEGLFVFRFLSGFFDFLHPFNFPIELLRDVIWNTLSVPQLILQSIRVEVGFIISIILAAMASLIVPAYGLCYLILMLLGKKKSKSESSIDDDDYGGACERRLLLLIMQILLLLSFFGIGVMVIGNEFANNGARLAGTGIRAAGRDVSAYLHATHRDLSHVVMDSADQAIAAADHDLDSADVLLGIPIQKALAVETGIGVALESLLDISSASVEMSAKVSSLAELGSRAASIASTAKERLRELRRQLEMARDNCPKGDRPLCETIDTTGLDLVIKFEMLSEKRLQPLIAALSAQNLSDASENGRSRFYDIPKTVANQTKYLIEDVRGAMMEKRGDLLTADRSFGKVIRHLAAKMATVARKSRDLVRAIDAIEFWRWFLFLNAVVIIAIITLLLMIAIFCGCCGAETYGSCVLKISVALMCLLAVPMWILAIVVFAAGGHGEVFICRPLYDEPEYKVLGKLLDNPGLLYKEKHGFFDNIFNELENITIDQPIRNILRECRDNRPAYPVFHVRKFLDINVETAYFNWSRLEIAKDKLKNCKFSLNVATPHIQSTLLDIMNRTKVNFTEYRMQLTGPITGKDLTSLSDQLESIANQNSDLSTSSRIETLASRTRRVITTNVQPLEQLRTELVYRLTELELQIVPFQRQMNQSLSHLKTIQYYIDKQGGIIAEKKLNDYVRRLTEYLEQYRGHVLDQIEGHVSPCRPIWDIYDAARTLICRHYIDSLNGYWLGLTSSLILWIAIAPLAMNLHHSFREMKKKRSGMLLRNITHHEQQQENWR